MQVKIKKLHPDAITPTYGTDGAACFDIYTLTAGGIDGEDRWPVCDYSTGLSFEIPKDHVMLVFSRSGHGFKHDVRLSNCVGVIDSDYRGELKVKLTADKYGSLDVNAGDRIAQAMILPVQQVKFMEVDELSVTERGIDGFGSTGA